eukprot:sb/3461457/
MVHKQTTEEVVDSIAGKPSPSYVILWLLVVTFRVVCALVAYFPNFGGYLPYTMWRCSWESEECFNRLENFTDTAIIGSGNPGDTFYLDSYCSVVLAEPATRVLTISSGSDCVGKCTVTVDLEDSVTDCRLEFPTPRRDNNILICHNTDNTTNSIDLDEGGEAVVALENSTANIRFVQFVQGTRYKVHCTDKAQYNKDTMCGVVKNDVKQGKLQDGTDFIWDLKGGTLYDLIGRKYGALIGYAIVTIATFAVSASPNVIFLFVCRFLQGVGVFVGFTGMYLLMLEYTACRWRSLANSGILMMWAVGYLLTSLIGYTVYSWRWNSAITGFAFIIPVIPLILIPESARYLVGKDNAERATVNLKWLAKLNNSSLDAIDLELTDREQQPEEEPTFIQSLKDFWVTESDMVHKQTTEEVVDSIAGKPSPSYVILWLLVVTFRVVCALVAYFPNFGGYLPYTMWRCSWESEECFNRLENFTDTAIIGSGNPGDTFYLDSYCSVVLAEPATRDYKMALLDGEGKALGELTTKAGVLTISSGSDCVGKCTVTVDLEDSVTDCRLEFPTPRRDNNILICHNVDNTTTSIDLDEGGEAVVALENCTSNIRFVQFVQGSGYNVHCPDKAQYNKDTMCGVVKDDVKQGKLQDGADFIWDLKGRSYFTQEWDLLCDREWLKAAIGSIYFGGAFLGTLGGGTLYDLIGRKYGALIGYAIVTIATFAVSASPNVIFLFVCRFLQGVGVFVGFTGMYLLMLEYTACRWRSLANSGILMMWAVGYLLTSLIGYTVYSWRWNSAITGFVSIIPALPLVLIPESARFLLVGKDNAERAMENLKWLAKLNNSSLDIDNLKLTDREQLPEKQPTFMQSLKDFWVYKELAIQTLCQMWLWIVSGLVYYGFGVSWSSLSSDMYIGYLMAAVGEVIAYILMVPMLDKMGRKWANMCFFFIGAASFLVAMANVNLGAEFTLTQLSCLIGSMAIAAVFASIYLYTMELAPTSHSGKILGYSSGIFLLCRWSNIGALIIFAVLSVSAGLVLFRLPDTAKVPTPSTAGEVQARRDGTGTVIKNPAVLYRDLMVTLDKQ